MATVHRIHRIRAGNLKLTLSIDGKVLKIYKSYCHTEGLIISKQIEKFMKKKLEEKEEEKNE